MPSTGRNSLGLFLQSGGSFCGRSAYQKSVDSLYTSSGFAHHTAVGSGIRASLQAELKQPVTIDVEYVDSDRLGGKEAIEKWFALLLLKYNATPPDLIIPVFDPTALAFANHAQGLFPQSYVVFCSINETTKANLQINERTAGVIYKIDYVKRSS